MDEIRALDVTPALCPVWPTKAGHLDPRIDGCPSPETMERHPDIGLRSYDRLFPNQDTLPKGGFGNLIADRLS